MLLVISEEFVECGGSEMVAAAMEVQQKVQQNSFGQLTLDFTCFFYSSTRRSHHSGGALVRDTSIGRGKFGIGLEPRSTREGTKF